MDGLNIFTPYEIRARIFPSIIVLLPIIVLFFSIIPFSDTIEKILLGLGIFIVIIYAFTYQVRVSGVNFQKKNWKINGGPPSTIIMRWDDTTFSKELKSQFYAAITKKYSVIIPTENEQRINPNHFDRIINDVFIRVRSDLHKSDSDNLWSRHNAEYGFVRNLLGSRWIWLFFSILGTSGCVILYYLEASNFKLLGLFINLILSLISIVAGWHSLPKMFDYVGYEYAKSAWGEFLSHSDTN